MHVMRAAQPSHAFGGFCKIVIDVFNGLVYKGGMVSGTLKTGTMQHTACKALPTRTARLVARHGDGCNCGVGPAPSMAGFQRAADRNANKGRFTMVTSLDFYKPVFSRWPKGLGPLPTPELIDAARALVGSGRNGKHVLALAMYLRPGYGATDAEVRAAAAKLNAAGGIQGSLHNYRRACEAEGLVSRDMTVGKRDNETVYQVTLTPKGSKVVSKRADLDAKRAQADADKAHPQPPKARKPKAVPVPVGSDCGADTGMPVMA